MIYIVLALVSRGESVLLTEIKNPAQETSKLSDQEQQR